MILKVLMTYEVDETTGEIKYIGKEEVNVDTAVTAKKSTKVSEPEDKRPLLILDSNKYKLNTAAMTVLNVSAGDTVHINYPKVNGVYVPAIAKSSTLGVQAGNKITKSCTVSFRGEANERLSEFGTTFELQACEKEGVFHLMSEQMLAPKPELEEVIKIDDDFELDDLNDIDLDTDATNITLDLTL